MASQSRRQFLKHGVGVSTLALLADSRPLFASKTALPLRPAVQGTLRLKSRRRELRGGKNGKVVVIAEPIDWKVSETAITICDMWADHPCHQAAIRVDAMAPRMNRVVSAARGLGVTIVHAPSSGIKFYKDTPFRQRVLAAPPIKPPAPIASWCALSPKDEAPLPIDDGDGGCDDPVSRPKPGFDRHEHPAIKLTGFDGVSDNGQEVYNFFRQLGIRNVVLMGVHTNMCVLGRSFGIRQMVRLGMNVVLARDLTDAMYDPRDRPHVSHTRGTEMVVEHIERYWCPSILGGDLMTVVAGTDSGTTTAGTAGR
jgi:nicotinamidase-related amidase